MTDVPPTTPLERPPPPAPTRRRAFALVVAGLVVVVALVAGVAVVVAGGDDDEAAPERSADRRDDEPGGDDGAPSSTAPPDELEAAVRELTDFVEQQRGAPFREAVEVELLDDAAFVARLQEDAEEDEAEIAESGRLLQAVGLLEPDEDLAAAVRRFAEDGVLGFYDPETDELVVRGAELSPSVRSTLVHELTHAYDDQRFELHRPDLDEADDESGFGFTALVEGNAVRVQEAWEQGLPADQRAELRKSEGSATARLEDADLPPIVLQIVSLPYVVGPQLVQALLQAGDEARVDAALAAPPTTSEQVLEPDAYVDGPEPAVEVPEPAAEEPVEDRGVFGEAGVLLTLAPVLGVPQAQEAASGWGGDRYVTWRVGGLTCVRVAFAGDRPTDVRELASAWTAWARTRPDADVDQADGRVVVTSCA